MYISLINPSAILIKRIAATINEVIKLAIIPESDTMMLSLFGCLKLRELIGTGFAQPNRNNRRQISPTGSRCFTGSSVILPRLRAVESPHL